MTKTSQRDHALFISAFILALVLRLIKLDSFPLSDLEANWALQAFHLLQNAHPALGSQPGYVLPTALLFFIFGSTDFMARIVPALAGSLLVLVPYILRERLPGKSAILLAFFLALEPGLLAVSRAVGGPILAVSFTLLAMSLWLTKQPAWAGFFGALALLSGPALWPGLIALGTAWLVAGGWASLRRSRTDIESAEEGRYSPWQMWKPALIAGGVTLLAVGTLLFLFPAGLGAAFSSLPDYLHGWTQSREVPLTRLVLALAVYEPFFVFFAVIAIVRGILARDRQVIFLSVWLAAALVFALLYPARLVVDLAWALVPLAALAALEVSQALGFDSENRWEIAGMAVLTFSILIFAALDFAGIALTNPSPEDTRLRWILLGGALALLAVSITLIALGWSLEVARKGALWGFITVMTLYTISVATGASGLRANETQELWRTDPQPAQAALLLKTIDDLSTWKKGAVDALNVTVYGVDSPSLAWTLRNQPVTFATAAPTGSSSDIVIGPFDPKAAFGAEYRGQDFVWRRFPGWNTATFPEWLRWFAVHEMPQGEEAVLLWARTDLFMDSQNKPQP
jgi:MFS family permease